MARRRPFPREAPGTYERGEADTERRDYDRPELHLGGAAAGGLAPFLFRDDWRIPYGGDQAVQQGWPAGRPMGVTWHWAVCSTIGSLDATLGGAHAARKGSASAHYGVGRSFAEGVHRYVYVSDRSYHAGVEQTVRWDGKPKANDADKGTRTTIGIETVTMGHEWRKSKVKPGWIPVADDLGGPIWVEPWTEPQVTMMIAVAREIQGVWGHLGPRSHHGHSDLCPSYKTDVTGFPFARVLRGVYGDAAVPDVWTPFTTVEGRQRALILLGYDLGATGADGQWGKRSKQALADFKTSRGLAPRERPDDPIGGHWSTFVGWAVFDTFQERGLDFGSLHP